MINSDTENNKTLQCEAWLRCLNRTPNKDYNYYLLLGCVDGVVSYYSKGVAWSQEEETRVARLVKGIETIKYYKEKGIDCLILESLEEFEVWGSEWSGHALIEANVWLASNC